MDFEIKNGDRCNTYVDLDCPGCRNAAVRYWPEYDDPGELLSCHLCGHLYELIEKRDGTISPVDLDAASM